MSDNFQEKIKSRIVDYMNLNSGGRLIIFKTESAAKGADLIVKKKGDYVLRDAGVLAQNPIVKTQVFGSRKDKDAKEIYLRVNGKIKTSDESILKVKINADDFNINKNFYLIFVFFNVIKQDLDDNICIMSLEQFKKNAEILDKNVFQFESFLSPDKKDKYSQFLVDKKDLSKFFLDKIL